MYIIELYNSRVFFLGKFTKLSIHHYKMVLDLYFITQISHSFCFSSVKWLLMSIALFFKISICRNFNKNGYFNFLYIDLKYFFSGFYFIFHFGLWKYLAMWKLYFMEINVLIFFFVDFFRLLEYFS